MNLVILIGRLTKDNDIKYLQNGNAVLSNSIAVKRDFKNAQGEVEVDFININAFGQTAEYLKNYASKGTMISIEGRWQQRNYVNSQGIKVYIDDCVVNKASILSQPNENPVQNQQQRPQPAQQRTQQVQQPRPQQVRTQPAPQPVQPEYNANQRKTDIYTDEEGQIYWFENGEKVYAPF